jgi:hypothetical protein
MIDQKYLITQQGKRYVLYAGLLDLAHQLSEGRLRIATRLIQAPSPDNGQTAVCAATAGMYDEAGQLVRECSGLGDASPGNVNRMMAAHLIRMGETRSKARALRDLTNVAEAIDEADETVPGAAPEPAAPAAPVDELTVLRRRYARLALRAKAKGIDAPPLSPDARPEDITTAGKELQTLLERMERVAAGPNGAPAS